MKVGKIVISHVKNEEYLLNWWLPHHKPKFDHGIIIDYNSTDRTRDIIKEICPTWQIIQSRNKEFGALDADLEVMSIEKAIQNQYPRTWMIALNVTEFLIGDTNKLELIEPRTRILVNGSLMVDSCENKFIEPDKTVPLIRQRYFGVKSDSYECRFRPDLAKINIAFQKKRQENAEFMENGGPWATNRIMRSMHNYDLDYTKEAGWAAGRHFWGLPSPDFHILWYGYSPYTKQLIDRRLAIPNTIPIQERNIHLINKTGLDIRFDFYQENAVCMKEYISSFEPNIMENI
jgi:hypothetical protein